VATRTTSKDYLNKLPMVTALFWFIKIVATTLGESVSNYFAITPLKLGYAVSAGIFVVLFAVTLVAQMKVDRFRPAVFWSVILATSILGTSVSDFMNRTVGLGYTGGFAVLTTCLIVALVVWKLTGQNMGVERIDTVKAEVLYWVATLISNTLGTSSGDFKSNSLGLGSAPPCCSGSPTSSPARWEPWPRTQSRSPGPRGAGASGPP